MESPVVVDKPPEYLGNDRGFPFEEEEGSGAWSELAARHPDIAARLRQRPATWARKRRPSSQDAADEFGDSFGGFDRFPFDDIPPEFRDHFPTHWNRRHGSREPQQPQPSSPQPQQQTTATQTEHAPAPVEDDQQTPLPQYGLRNTVDLGQKSPADPSLVDADERTHRSMSAPPDTASQTKMSGHNHHDHQQHNEQSSNVRHIPIFVEGRDEPVINKSVDHGTHFGETKPAYVPPPPQQPPHVDRDQYFADDGPVGFHPPPNFSRAFGTPFNKGFRQGGSQPFVQQKVYPQTAFARGASPQRSQSPKPHDEHYVKVPVHHEQAAPKTDPPSRAQQKSPQHHQPPPRQQQSPQPPPQREQTPPQNKPQPSPVNDPITQILSIQTDVLNLMTDVENFTGTKKDKRYIFLDEMLTRNLIKLDNIETDGKENIRLARKEAIRCIQKCIAVLEAKAESQSTGAAQPQPQDVEMKENTETGSEAIANEQVTENGEVEMKEATKEEKVPEVVPQIEKQISQTEQPQVQPEQTHDEKKDEQKPQDEKTEVPPPENKEAPAPVPENKDTTQPQAPDTRPDENKAPEEHPELKVAEQKVEENDDRKPSPKKVTKTVKKRDKSKDKKESKDSNKNESVEQTDKKEEKTDIMQVDDKGDKLNSQIMDVDGAASQ